MQRLERPASSFIFLAGQVAAPHGFDIAGVCLASSFTSSMVVALQVRFSRFAKRGHTGPCPELPLRRELRSPDLQTQTFSRVSRRTSTHWFFSISLGADLQTQRHALHLPLGKLPAGCVVGVVQLHAELRSSAASAAALSRRRACGRQRARSTTWIGATAGAGSDRRRRRGS